MHRWTISTLPGHRKVETLVDVGAHTVVTLISLPLKEEYDCISWLCNVMTTDYLVLMLPLLTPNWIDRGLLVKFLQSLPYKIAFVCVNTTLSTVLLTEPFTEMLEGRTLNKRSDDV